MINLYEIIGVSTRADMKEIGTALDAKDHAGNPNRIAQIEKMRNILLNPVNRLAYDIRLFTAYPHLKHPPIQQVATNELPQNETEIITTDFRLPKNNIKQSTIKSTQKGTKRKKATAPKQPEPTPISTKEINMDFSAKLYAHAEHVRKVAHLCTTEETTKQALILPLLDILGFSAFDPSKVRAEFQADFQGVKAGERVDYALFCNDVPVMYIEAKANNQNLTNHAPQLSRYFNSSPNVSISAITNGSEWRFFTDLDNKNIMDKKPFLTIDVCEITEADIVNLQQFCFDKFQPENLRTLAEENIYLSAFTEAIKDSLKEVDLDFVKYIAGRANIQRQFTQKFLESIQPLVKQAVENTLSTMVLSGLNQKEPEKTPEAEEMIDPYADIVDPNNPKIVTTWAERQILELTKSLLPENAQVDAKDTESYYSVLANGKVNRWILRYFDGKKRQPAIILPINLTDSDVVFIQNSGLEMINSNQIVLEQPEYILRIAYLIRKSYDFCCDDNNFRRLSSN